MSHENGQEFEEKDGKSAVLYLGRSLRLWWFMGIPKLINLFFLDHVVQFAVAKAEDRKIMLN